MNRKGSYQTYESTEHRNQTQRRDLQRALDVRADKAWGSWASWVVTHCKAPLVMQIRPPTNGPLGSVKFQTLISSFWGREKLFPKQKEGYNIEKAM